jgi:Protein of unknown function (DUF2971)
MARVPLKIISMSAIIPPSKIPDGLLWHYTDFNGFNGIREGTIWASDINYLNDSAEFKHLFDVAATVFKDVPTPYKDWDDPGNGMDTTFRRWIGSYAGKMYVSSFSKVADDLSQWRGYARTPPGFALGFDIDLLSAATKNERFELVPCEYKLAAQKAAVTAVVQRHYEALKKEAGFDEHLHPSAVTTRFYSATFGHICRDLVVECMRCKSPAFEGEEEYRVIASEQFGAGRVFTEAEVFYRQSGSLVVPYVKWKISRATGAPSPLRFVLVGPGPHADEVIAVVRRMCPDVGVGKSAVPYRNW